MEQIVIETSRDANCKFFLLRYVPDAVKNEFVNIGLVLLPPTGRPELRFSKDWSRVQAVDPQADIEFLEAFRKEISKETDVELVLRKVEDSFSNGLQASESKACLAPAPAQEADALARMYLETPPRSATREQGPRLRIYKSMERAFRETGAWRVMEHDIPVSDYTASGDPLTIDCGYGHGSTVKLFHAMPLNSGVNSAKALAFSYPALAQGIRRKRGFETQLTAIVEDDLDRHAAPVNFAFDVLEQQHIRVAGVVELPQLAQAAAQELGIQ